MTKFDAQLALRNYVTRDPNVQLGSIRDKGGQLRGGRDREGQVSGRSGDSGKGDRLDSLYLLAERAE